MNETAGRSTSHRGHGARPHIVVFGCTMLTLGGCTGAPAINVVGSFFPAWMLCSLIGIASAVCLRGVLGLLGLEQSLPVPLLTHAAVAVAATLAVWLIWFGH